FTNGSGCGNETASERYMMSKFMVDSCEFWAYEYNISGFRFDLMGLHDTDTMNAIASTVKALDSSIMVYGEPWTGGSTPLSGDRQAKIDNIDKMPNVGTFNDSFRDAVKGDAGYNKSDWGWVQGDQDGDEYNKIISGIYGNFAAGWGNPTQVINYVACHDNNTLHDKLDLTTNASGGKWTTAQIIAMAKQAYTLVLTSQGIPFILNGDEFLRTKTKEDGTYDENSYNSPDSVNAIDWSLKVTYNDYYNYIKALIALRKEHHGLFCSTTVNESGLAVTNHPWNNEWIVYTINNNDSSDSYKKLLVVMKNTDASYSDVNISSISGTWKLYYSSAGAAKNTNTYSTFAMNGREVYIFYSES
ncbi:MAG: type I pullulanase, partial [Gammaproteobacteria bacterium]|nr:type I pullulanase [Gammaproteobacteria bacterium]